VTPEDVAAIQDTMRTYRSDPVAKQILALCDALTAAWAGEKAWKDKWHDRLADREDLSPEAFYVALHPALVAWMEEEYGDTSASDALAEAFEPWYRQYLRRGRALDASFGVEVRAAIEGDT
jgi:hypothetical protein